jgi:TonB-dependent SusC/RagA subfamily outer membrane receptor
MKIFVIRLLVFSFFVCYSTSFLLGQEKVVQGTVTVYQSIPLINVSIQVKSTKEVVFSDTLGKFTVTCLPKDKLKLSAKGFSTQNVEIQEEIYRALVDLKLKPGPKSRGMAIGYGHVKDVDNLDAMSSLNVNDTDFSNYNDIYAIMRGRFPNVEINGLEIVIRGTQSFNLSDGALLILDDMIIDETFFSRIPPAEIASINILKGADAAMYGVRGGNGVVIVKTKQASSVSPN